MNWQDVIALSLVGLAVAFLLRGLLSRKSAAGGCHCPQSRPGGGCSVGLNSSSVSAPIAPSNGLRRVPLLGLDQIGLPTAKSAGVSDRTNGKPSSTPATGR